MRERTIDELKEDIVALRKQLFESRMAKATHKLENTSIISNLKHQIAQIKTVITEKEAK